MSTATSSGVSAVEKQAAAQAGNVHPIFAGILANIEQQPEQILRAQYIERLQRMDWEFERADDTNAWRRGKAELMALRELQIQLDPNAEIWNQKAPFTYLITRRVKVECDLPAGGYEAKWMCTGLSDADLSQFFMELHGIGTKVKVVTLPSNVAREVVA